MRSSTLHAALSMSVATIGAGVLAIPVTFQLDGSAAVLVSLASVALLTVFSIDCIVLCIERLGLTSFEEIAQELLGSTFKEAIKWLLFLYNMGTAVGYIIVVGNIFTPMLPVLSTYVPFLSSPAHVMVLLWGLVMLPLSLVPRLSSLRHLSVVAAFTIFFISGSIVYRYVVPAPPRARPVVKALPVKSTVIAAVYSLPVVVFSFDIQSLVFQIYSSVPAATRAGMAQVASLSVLLTGCIYAAVGYFGYLSFAPRVADNILLNYDPSRDGLFAACESLYSITVMLAYAIVLMPCRDAFFQAVKGFNHLSLPASPVLSARGPAPGTRAATDTGKARGYGSLLPAAGAGAGTPNHSFTGSASGLVDPTVAITDIIDERTGDVVGHIPVWENLAVSGGISVACLLCALLAPGFLYIVSLMGAFCASTICCFYPALFRHQLHVSGLAPYTPLERAGVGLLVLLGALGFCCGAVLLFM